MPSYTIDDLLYLMARLRDPNSGCPWDRKQNFQSITPHTLEEACEVIDAIEREDYPHLKEELGDLLFQVVFYGQLGEEQQHFNFADIVDSLVNKLLSRHSHVFPDGTLRGGAEGASGSSRQLKDVPDTTEIKQRWEAIKQDERNQRGESAALGDVPRTLTALMRANKLQKRASNLRFDWPDHRAVVDKVHEELGEVLAEVEKDNKSAIEEELGDLLFACVNLARHLGVDSERALRLANTKFERRFEAMMPLVDRERVNRESGAEGGLETQTDTDVDVFTTLTPEHKNRLWEAVKAAES
ncbi:MAG: nucleoside triphosphate pyrophosphohydrolase [Porticoccaceae bacterium]|nr:nucleoside triphosphate pyrophosphohydrolase [Porticoccaceae bacterium]